MAARFRARKTASWHDIIKWRIYWLAAWREIVQVRRYTKTGVNTFAWKTVYLKPGQLDPVNPPPVVKVPSTTVTLRVTIDPTIGSGAIVGTGTVTTNDFAATAVRGTGPYTYRWSRVSWSAPATPGILSISNAKTKFSQSITAPPPQTYTARFRCTATDSLGNRGSATVDVTFYALAPTTPTPDPKDYTSRPGEQSSL